jgi:uncharacterized protein YndB with AHSA1/START domain
VIEVRHTAHADAPRAEVWKRLADLQNWHSWGPWTKTEIDGEVRTMVSERKRMSGKPYVMKERVTALVPQERLEYDLLSGLPVRNYHGTVTLTDTNGGGTDIHWSSTFDPPWPLLGGLWRGAMLKVVRDVAEALARASEAGGTEVL